MASSYTTNYNLDKYVGTDKPNLRDQYNAAMDKIDAALLSANTNATEAKAATQSFQGNLDAVSSAVSDEVTNRQNADADLDTAISNETSARQLADAELATNINNLGALLPAANFDSTNTVKKYVDDNVNTLSGNIAAISANVNLIMGRPLFVVVGDSWTEVNTFGNWLTTFKEKMQVDVANYGYGGTGWNRENGNSTNHGKFSQQLAYAASQMSENDKKRTVGILALGGVNDFSNNSFNIDNTVNDIARGASLLASARDASFPNVPIYAAFNTQSYKYQSNPTLTSKMYRVIDQLVYRYLGSIGIIPLQNVHYSYLMSDNGFDASNLHLNAEGAGLLGSALSQAINGGYSANWYWHEGGPRNTDVSGISFSSIEYAFNNGMYSILPRYVNLNSISGGTLGTWKIPQTGGSWMFSIPWISSNIPFAASPALSANFAQQGWISFNVNDSNNSGPMLKYSKEGPSGSDSQTQYNAIPFQASIIWND